MRFQANQHLHDIPEHEATFPDRAAIKIEPGPTDGTLRAIATDGKILVRLAIERDEGDELPKDGVLLEPEAWKLGGQSGGELDLRADCARVKRKRGGTVELPHRENASSFPDHEGITPKSGRADEHDPTLRVCLDARLLLKIQRAFGASYVELTFARAQAGQLAWSRAITVKPIGEGDTGSDAVLMPCDLPEDRRAGGEGEGGVKRAEAVGALETVAEMFWTEGEPFEERLEQVQAYARAALKALRGGEESQ